MGKKLGRREVAEILGANSELIWKNGDNFFLVKVRKNGKWVARKVCELSEDEVKKLKSPATAWGIDFGHCLYLANKYQKDFKEQVCGYKIVPSDKEECPVSVLFYAKE